MSTDLAMPSRVIVTDPPHTASPPATDMVAALTVARDQGPERTTDQAITLLARALGRQAARRHLARGWSMFEVALALVVAALALATALYFQAHYGRTP